MARATRGGGPARGGDRAVRRLAWMMGTRLVLSGAVLAVALALEHRGRAPGGLAAQDGLYVTLAFAFLATALYGALGDRFRRSPRWGAAQLAVDVALVTAVVYFSGGRDSLFAFLYVLLPVYGAAVFGVRGAFAAGLLAGGAYGAMLMATRLGWLPHYGEAHGGPLAALLAQWGIQTGAILLVSLLASVLARELERAGEKLTESASQLHRVRSLHERTVESLMSGLLTADLRGRITSFNREAERISGTSVLEVLGRPVDEVLPGARALVMAQASGGRPRERMAFRDRRGQERHLGLSGSILRDEEGAPSGHVVIFQDVTEVVRMEDELRRKQRLAAVGQLAADLAHEVRNPLAAISGAIQMLGPGGRAQAPRERERLMEIALRETDRLNLLITDFLQYARPLSPRLAPVRLAALVEDVLKMFEGARPPGVAVETAVDARLTVRADPGQLRQVLWNLCLNAAQAMPEGGSLAIRAQRTAAEPPQGGHAAGRNEAVAEEPGGVEICVSDTGVGIPPDVLDRIFDPFFTTKPKGTGLGLATVHRIVEAHGAEMRVESTLGAGTAFRIVLPAAEEAA